MEDMSRLNDEEFLNDEIVNFYIQYRQACLTKKDPDVIDSVYFFNTFFYATYSRKKDSKSNYEGVKRWTSKFDLFSKKYIFVPINENAHWYLALIYNLPGLIKEQEEKNKVLATVRESDSEIDEVNTTDQAEGIASPYFSVNSDSNHHEKDQSSHLSAQHPRHRKMRSDKTTPEPIHSLPPKKKSLQKPLTLERLKLKQIVS